MIWPLNVLRSRWWKFNRERRFKQQFTQFAALAHRNGSRFQLSWEEVLPCFGDDTATTGFDRHYIYHPAWAARIIRRTAPLEHVDISSTLHFCTMLSAFVPVRFYDMRPAELDLEGLTSVPGNLMALPFPDGSVPSISCMHTVEHVGLGRYGDPLDPDGDLKAIAELKRVTAPGGNLLFVTPTGKPRIVYNAHRIYSFDMIVRAFDGFELREFALVPDDPADGGLLINPDRAFADRQAYGCGCYWFVKRT